MFESILDNKLLKSSIISIILVMLILLTIPPTRDDKDVSLRNEVTGVKEYKQAVNEQFIVGVILAALLPIILFTMIDSQRPMPKRLTLPQIWSKVHKDEIMKYELQDVTSILMRGDYFFGQSTRNKNIWILRYIDTHKNAIINIALYAFDDYAKFMTSPIHGITTIPMGLDSAQTRLIKSQDAAAKVVQVAQQIGITPEELKRRLIEDELKSRERPEGDIDEENK